MSDEKIATISESAARDSVDTTEPHKDVAEDALKICFTGFSSSEKAELVAAAKAAGLKGSRQ